MEIQINTIMNFGKYKGELVSDLLPDNVDCETEASHFIPIIKYFAWIANKTEHNVSNEVQDRMKDILSKVPKRSAESYRGKSSLEHYNDMGYMNDLSFQDVYGDFGF